MDEKKEAVKTHPKLKEIFHEARHLILLVAVCILSLSTVHAKGGQSVLFGNLVPVNNITTNSSIVDSNTVNYAVGTITVTTGGLATTNAMTGYSQLSLDRTNFVNVGTYIPISTNAGTVTIPANVVTIPVYFRMSVTTTNSVNIGATLTQ